YYEELQRKQARIDSENIQPIYDVQIPPCVVTPPPIHHEHLNIKYFLSSIVYLTIRSESDEETDNDFDADTRDPRNLTLDEYLDGDDVNDEESDQERVFLNDTGAFDNVYYNPENNISVLFASYRLNAQQIAQESSLSIEAQYHEILSLSHILLLQADNFSDLQIQEFSRALFREYIETALDDDLGLGEAEKAIEGSFTKSFQDTTDQKKFEIMRFIFLQLVRNIPINPVNELLSEGTLTVNIISPILRFFFHNATIHPSIWPNTASMSAKVQKLANFDPSRAKQPDMIGSIVNNNKSSYKMMFGEITG
ncbi:1180_t:CDS:2, partial [Acaulospora morrowiae]